MKRKAFTLVEMLMVVLIIGILAAAILPRLSGATDRARDTARITNLSQLESSLAIFFDENSYYPSGTCANDLAGSLVPKIMNNIPKDPQKGRYTYGTRAGGCQGEYAYGVLNNAGAQSGGMVLIANLESDNKRSNWVLDDDVGNYQDIHFGPSLSNDADKGTFNDSAIAKQYVCDGVRYDDTTSPKNELFDGTNKVCKYKDNGAMVYVRLR